MVHALLHYIRLKLDLVVILPTQRYDYSTCTRAYLLGDRQLFVKRYQLIYNCDWASKNGSSGHTNLTTLFNFVALQFKVCTSHYNEISTITVMKNVISNILQLIKSKCLIQNPIIQHFVTRCILILCQLGLFLLAQSQL